MEPLDRGDPQDLLDAEERIAQDVPCAKCGENLRARALNEDCPACGHPVLDTVFGDTHVHATRGLVLKLADSVRLLLYGAGLLGVLVALGLAVTVSSAEGFYAGLQGAFGMLLAGALMLPVLATAGLILLRPRHPAAYYKARYLSPASLWRLGITAALTLGVVGALAYHFSEIVSDLSMVVWAVIPLAVFLRRVQGLMHRLPNIHLFRYARVQFALTLVCGMFAAAVLILRIVAMDEPDFHNPLMAMTLLTFLGAVALAASGLLLLVRVERALHEAGR